jgi:hypothetical protein
MPAFHVLPLAATGRTGANTDGPVSVIPYGHGPVALEFIVEAAGGSPSVTVALQGSFDNITFVPIFILPAGSDTAVASFAATSAITFLYFVAQKHSRSFPYYQSVTTSNSNMTYRSNLWISEV